jgi:hypothetical protein
MLHEKQSGRVFYMTTLLVLLIYSLMFSPNTGYGQKEHMRLRKNPIFSDITMFTCTGIVIFNVLTFQNSHCIK